MECGELTYLPLIYNRHQNLWIYLLHLAFYTGTNTWCCATGADQLKLQLMNYEDGLRSKVLFSNFIKTFIIKTLSIYFLL